MSIEFLGYIGESHYFYSPVRGNETMLCPSRMGPSGLLGLMPMSFWIERFPGVSDCKWKKLADGVDWETARVWTLENSLAAGPYQKNNP